MPVADRLHLPCWGCIQPQASDTRLWLVNVSDDDFANQQSPFGLPLSCCRIHAVGAMPMDAAPARTR
jgi:hypothetical protein